MSSIRCPATWLRCYRACRKECSVQRERREAPNVVMATLTYPTGSLGEEAVDAEAYAAAAAMQRIEAELIARYGTKRVYCS